MADDRAEMSVSEVSKEKTGNQFANDGSFLEMFKKKMKEQKALNEKNSAAGPDKDESTENTSPVDRSSEKMEKSNISSLVGKRRSGGGAKVLKTGIVKKPKQDDDETPDETKDGWSKYMAEVNKYKSKICTDEDKTRPLVK